MSKKILYQVIIFILFSVPDARFPAADGPISRSVRAAQAAGFFRFRSQDAPRFARQKTKTSSAYEIQSFAAHFHAGDAPLLLSHKSFS